MDIVIKIKTWVCLNCKAHQDNENGSVCFSCGLEVIPEINPLKQASVTIKSIEKIEDEIEILEKRNKIIIDKTIDISTKEKKDIFIANRKKEREEEIKKNKLLEVK